MQVFSGQCFPLRLPLVRDRIRLLSVPDFQFWCEKNGKRFDELLIAGVEVGVLWRDGRQFHIPYGIRMALGLPEAKLDEVLERLCLYVL